MSYVVRVSGPFGNIGPILIYLSDNNISIKDLKQCIEYETTKLEGQKLYPMEKKSPKMHIIYENNQNLVKQLKIRQDDELLSSSTYSWHYDSNSESSTFAHTVINIILVEKVSQYKQLIHTCQKK